MAQVPAAVSAGDFNPLHAHAYIGVTVHSIWQVVIEGRPSTA